MPGITEVGWSVLFQCFRPRARCPCHREIRDTGILPVVGASFFSASDHGQDARATEKSVTRASCPWLERTEVPGYYQAAPAGGRTTVRTAIEQRTEPGRRSRLALINLKNAVERAFLAKTPRAQRTYSKAKIHPFGEDTNHTHFVQTLVFP